MPDSVFYCVISGGSIARIAIAEPGHRPREIVTFPVKSLDDFKTAVTDFLVERERPRLRGAAVSAGGWQTDDGLSMPNYPFRLGRETMKELLDVDRVHMVNECAARAMSIPRLRKIELLHICGPKQVEDYVQGLISAGEGLGMATIVKDDPLPPVILHCEGGHSDLAATTALERQVLGLLVERFGHVSRERVLSLDGLVTLWQCLCQIKNIEYGEPPNCVEIIDLANSGNGLAEKVIDLCGGWLAAHVSDMALNIGATGGIYLSGKLIDSLSTFIHSDLFTARYADKGRLSSYVNKIPIYRLNCPEAEFIGLSTLFD